LRLRQPVLARLRSQVQVAVANDLEWRIGHDERWLCRGGREEDGELRVGVHILAPESGRSLLEITVEDTGVGITAAALTQVFEPFFTTKPQGTGLGLAIAHRIVEDHGGEIRVQSEPWRGTRFTISIPVSEA